MAIVITVTGDTFIITIDEVQTLVKDREDILCKVSSDDSTIVQIWETSPNEGQRNIIFQSKYDNFTTPSGASASAVCTGINALIVAATTVVVTTTVSNGDYGDITVSGSGLVWTIDNDVVTYAKMQNVSATDRILGRSSAGAGDVQEIVCTSFARSLLDDATNLNALTTLGGTTVGQSLFTATNPSAISYIRINADNSVTFLTLAQLYTELQPSIKDDERFTVPVVAATSSPADSTTYYFGVGGLSPTATDSNHDWKIGEDCSCIGFVIAAVSNTISGGTETSELYLRNVTDGTSTKVGDFRTDGSTTVSRTTTMTGVSINVDANDDICFEWRTPAWAINPTLMILRGYAIFKRR